MRQLAKMRHDKSIYLSRAKEQIHDLERAMIDELERETERDAGWDTAALREALQERAKQKAE